MDLSTAYVRRKHWEARILSIEVGKLFSNGSTSSDSKAVSNKLPGAPVKSDDLLTMMGVTIKGA